MIISSQNKLRTPTFALWPVELFSENRRGSQRVNVSNFNRNKIFEDEYSQNNTPE